MKTRGPWFWSALFLGLVVVATLAAGCTVRVGGEMSMMKQWDRPNEALTFENKTPVEPPPAKPAATPVPAQQKTMQDLEKALQELEDTIKKSSPPPQQPPVKPSGYSVPPVESEGGYYLYKHVPHDGDHGDRACFAVATRILYATVQDPTEE